MTVPCSCPEWLRGLSVVERVVAQPYYGCGCWEQAEQNAIKRVRSTSWPVWLSCGDFRDAVNQMPASVLVIVWKAMCRRDPGELAPDEWSMRSALIVEMAIHKLDASGRTVEEMTGAFK